jgi:hypothetical protein
MGTGRKLVLFFACTATFVGTAPAVAQEKCPSIRTATGACAKPALVDAARRVAMIVPSMRVSYFGTPAGTTSGKGIPGERLFRDDPLLFGLPTVTTTTLTAFPPLFFGLGGGTITRVQTTRTK